MRGIKKYISIVLCGTFIYVSPARAFWPVLDFGEIIPVVGDVSAMLENLSQAKEQLMQMKGRLTAIGKSISTITSFSKDFSNALDNIADVVNDAVEDFNKATGSNININDKLNNVSDKVNGFHNNLANGLVNNTDDLLKNAENMVDKANDKITHVENEITPKKEPIKNEKPVQEESPVEEEEEEEEISELTTEQESLLAEVRNSFMITREENKKIAEQFNDVLDNALSELHSSMEKGVTAMNKLQEAVNDAANLTEDEKKALGKDVASLITRQKDVSEKMSAIVENLKDQYNAEFNTRVLASINNYEKAVEQYIRGDADKEAVVQAGENFKNEVASVNVKTDTDVLNKIKIEIEKVKEEAQALNLKIKKQITASQKEL